MRNRNIFHGDFYITSIFAVKLINYVDHEQLFFSSVLMAFYIGIGSPKPISIYPYSSSVSNI